MQSLLEGLRHETEGQLRFLRTHRDGVVHLRVESQATLCGIDTADCGDYTTGRADVEGAPEATCAVCAERRASPDLAAQLLEVARRTGARRRLRARG
jgi:hypothetical protein